MSAGYSAIGWNRQKRIYDGFIALFCFMFLAIFISATLFFNSQATFETLIIRATSTLAVLLLHIILAIGPLTRLNRKFLPLLYNRRHLGVTMFVFAAIHGVFSLIQFHSLGNTGVLVSLFTSNTNFSSLTGFPFQALGFFALIIFLLMAATSHDFWLHNLSPRIWKSLHMLVYLAYFLVIMHVMLGVIQFETNPLFFIMVITGCCILVTLHIAAAMRERKDDKKISALVNNGFHQVCAVKDIKPNRAKMFCLDKERIAVYRFDDKIFAIHNVCKHQGGPLGEGKIIDGCITCPWHGYQYLPENGQSPPPFQEKVSTYQVKVVKGEIWLHAKRFPEGTAQQGASVND